MMQNLTAYRDRTEAGQYLAGRLASYRGSDVLVLGLPRGGVPVAYEIAAALDAPLDVFVVRKLGVPGHPELAMGALASGGVRVLNEEVITELGISPEQVEAVTFSEQAELVRREQRYREGRRLPPLEGRTVILVDDGLATGSTMRAAVAAVRQHRPRRVVVAVPVGARETCRVLASEADEVVCGRIPEPFYAVGLWYQDFTQTTDDEVRELLRRAAARTGRGQPDEHVHI
jgi:predicted phosphoribosyltransferase